MSEIIATINGQAITTDDFNFFLNDLPQEQRQYITNPEAKEYFKEQMIATYLFEAYANDIKLDESEEFAKRMKAVRRNVISQLAVEELFKDILITEEAKKEYFEANKAKFAKGAQANAKHILMSDEEELKKVLEEINSGAKSFEDAAKEYSSCPSSAKGGDLGTFGPGQMVKEFDEVVFSGEIGKVLGPVRTQFGYHLIKIEKRTEGEEAVYENVAPYIDNQLLQELRTKAYTDKLVELQAKYQQ